MQKKAAYGLLFCCPRFIFVDRVAGPA